MNVVMTWLSLLGFRKASVVGLGLLAMFGSAHTTFAQDSQLRVRFGVFCSDWNEFTPAIGCQSAQSFWVIISNPNDFEVFEGSEVLSESLSIEVFSSNGERVAWWQPDDEGDGGSGGLRRWAPGEEIIVDVPWYFQTGPFVGSFFGTEEEFERPIAPWASPSCTRFVQRLPALPGGNYTLRFDGAETGRDSWDIRVYDVIEFEDGPSLEPQNAE